MLNEQIYLTREGMENLQKQCDGIDEEIQIARAQMTAIAKSDVNLREDEEYRQLMVKINRDLPEKRSNMLDIIRKAQIVEHSEQYRNFDGQSVIIGSKVTVVFDGELETYVIVGYGEGDTEKGTVSSNAPIAQKLVGKKVGEMFNFNSFQVKIEAVEKYSF